MLSNFFTYVEPISIFVVFTFVLAISFLDKKKLNNKILLAIISVCLLTEIATLVLVVRKEKIDLVYSASMLLHGSLWLLLLYCISKRKAVKLMLMAFLLFGLFNLVFIEKGDCNFYTFIAGGLLYIALFIYESFLQLRNENFSFFLSRKYLLLSVPILFFFGFSFIFGFKSDELAERKIFGLIELFDFIAYFSNISYYTLINIYIYRERRLKYAG